MENGTLYASKEKKSAYAKVLKNALKGDDVALRLNWVVLLNSIPVYMVIIQIPTINRRQESNACNLKRIMDIYNRGFDRVGIMGTVSRAVTNKLDINVDFEFATPNATVAAAKRGLSVLVFAVGNMSKSMIKKLEQEDIKYTVEDILVSN